MYPHSELTALSLRKAAVRRDITRLRGQCAAAVVRVARPLAWLDRVVAFARRLSPLLLIASVPAGLVAQRLLFPRFKVLGLLLRWGPPALATVRGLRTSFQSKSV